MMDRRLRKVTALFCALMILGTGACKSEPVRNDLPEQTGAGVSAEQKEQTENPSGNNKEQNEGKQEQNDRTQVSGDGTTPVTPSPEIGELIDAVIHNQASETAERTATVKLSDSGVEITGSGCKMDGGRLEIKKQESMKSAEACQTEVFM